MGSTAITGELIWPSQNDLYGASVGGSVGDGKMSYERQYRKVLGSVAGWNNYVISGGTLPATDPDLTIAVAAGAAIIEGHYCEWPATNITLPASNTSHLFLKLVYSGTLITGLEIEDNTSGTAPASSTKLGTATTSGSATTSTTDARILGPVASEVLTSGTTYTWKAGIYRMRVRVYGAGGGGGGGGSAGSAGASDGNNGGNGGTGGSTNFGSLTAVGGSGGGGGGKGLEAATNGADGAKGALGGGSGGTILTGMGMPPGGGGAGGPGAGSRDGGTGGEGGEGGYCEGWLTGTPGSTTSYAIGAAGTAGTAGSSTGGAAGTAGQAGQAGRIVIEY